MASPANAGHHLVTEEIQHIAESTRRGSIDFSIAALSAGNSSKLLVLNIEELRQSSARRSELASLEGFVLAFWTFPMVVFHVILPG